MRFLVSVALSFAVLAITLSAEARAAARRWERASEGFPPTTYVFTLEAHPKWSQVLYAGTIWRGVYKTFDRGGSWTSTAGNLPLLGSALTLLPADVTALALDPRVPWTVYAGTSFSGVMKTEDAGASWDLKNEGIRAYHAPTIDSPTIHMRTVGVEVDQERPDTVYAAMRVSGVVRTEDGGRSWTAFNSGLTTRDLNSLALDPSVPERLLVGTLDKGIFRTVDGGEIWRPANGGLTNRVVHAIEFDPSRRGVVYAGTERGVFKSVNGGKSWRATSRGLKTRFINDLAVDPNRPGTVYAATPGGVYRTANGGKTWRPLTRGMETTLVQALTVDARSGTVYAGTLGFGVYALRRG